MTHRDVLIREMGLGPVWKLRGPRLQEAGQPEEAVTNASAPVVTPGVTPGMTAGMTPAVRRVPSSLPPPRAPASPRAAVAPVAPVVDADREQRILGMDWIELKAEVSACQACSLHKTRRNTVFGTGNESAEWMLVGEAPGAEEDARGEPFVGQAGQLLDNMLAALDMDRGKHVYIANVLKCRPPGNRNPDPAEVAQCSPHLIRQMALVRPRLILALGRFATQALLGSEASIASLRGKLHQYQGVPVIVTYHPAYLLRNLVDKAKAWEDLCFARRTLLAAQG